MSTNSLARLTYELVAKPDTALHTLSDAVRFIASLTPGQRSYPHWTRAILALNAATHELGYIAMATMNLETALVLDHLLEREPDRPR